MAGQGGVGAHAIGVRGPPCHSLHLQPVLGFWQSWRCSASRHQLAGGKIRVGQGMSRSRGTLAPDAVLVHSELVAAIQIGSESAGKSQNELATFGFWAVD